jgi:cob(I)alamin adenosyltransferase
MKLYTKTGDQGETGLIGGARVPKDHPRVRAYGDVDETNAVIGLAVVTCSSAEICARLREVQATLFTLGAELANPGSKIETPAVTPQHIDQLERWIDDAGTKVEPLKSFVLPGGAETAARLHLARTVCRRAERTVVELARQEPVDALVIAYLNRLSDALFAFARLANHEEGVPDIRWTAAKPPETA